MVSPLADKLIIEPRKAICLDGPVYLQDSQIDEFIAGNIYKYLEKLKTNLMDDKGLQKHQRTAFRAILQQFSLFVRYDHNLESLEDKYLEPEKEDTNKE